MKDAINSASSITQNLTNELADGQRKILALVSANPKVLNPVGMQQSNGPMGGLPEMVNLFLSTLSYIIKSQKALCPPYCITQLIRKLDFQNALSLQQVEAPLDPTKELSRLISEHKFGEAFTIALQRSDVNIVSWLCSQVLFIGLAMRNPNITGGSLWYACIWNVFLKYILGCRWICMQFAPWCHSL